LSLKENMEAIKEELSSEEKFFESAIKTERFVKKYRTPLIIGTSALLLVTLGTIGYQMFMDSKREKANNALTVLLINPSDEAAKKELMENNHELYDVWMLSQAVAKGDPEMLEQLNASKAFGVADIASYELAAIQQDPSKLERYTKMQGAFYKDLAVVEEALIMVRDGKVSAAHQQLQAIQENSPMYQIAQMVQHYGVK